jgi:hypothetical protein
MSHLTDTYERLLEQQLAQDIAAGGDPFTVTANVIDKALGAKDIMELMGHADAKDMQLVALHFIRENIRRLSQ